jgi:hypothetical protein
MFLLIAVWLFTGWELAFGAEIDPAKLASEMPQLQKILAIIVGVQVGLYGLAECLTRVSVWTENKWDNKLAYYISQIAWALGALLGKFGYSVPKLILEEKAKQLNGEKPVGQ